MLLKNLAPAIRGLAADEVGQGGHLLWGKLPLHLTFGNAPELSVPLLHSKDHRLDLLIDAVIFMVPVHDAALRFLRQLVFPQGLENRPLVLEEFAAFQRCAFLAITSPFIPLI